MESGYGFVKLDGSTKQSDSKDTDVFQSLRGGSFDSRDAPD
jgi:hypothetical protein